MPLDILQRLDTSADDIGLVAVVVPQPVDVVYGNRVTRGILLHCMVSRWREENHGVFSDYFRIQLVQRPASKIGIYQISLEGYLADIIQKSL